MKSLLDLLIANHEPEFVCIAPGTRFEDAETEARRQRMQERLQQAIKTLGANWCLYPPTRYPK